jgi:hypothetical protein
MHDTKAMQILDGGYYLSYKLPDFILVQSLAFTNMIHKITSMSELEHKIITLGGLDDLQQLYDMRMTDHLQKPRLATHVL